MKYPVKQYFTRQLPEFTFTRDENVKGILYLEGDVYDVYNFNYGRFIELLEQGIIKEVKKEDV